MTGSPMTGVALTIGNFDGVHCGHQALIRRVVELARANRWRSGAVTFDPHPTKVLAPGRAPKLLMTLAERTLVMGHYGIQEVFPIPFTPQLSALSPEQFVAEILVRQLNAKAVVVGDNFRFGNKQAGDVKMLTELGKRYGFLTEVVGAVTVRGRVASSSAVRNLLAEGEVSQACRLLNRPYELQGEVASGHGIGSKQTVPTLNMDTAAEVLPAMGVYITSTVLPGQAEALASITNIGMRPTFNGDRLTIETYLLDPFSGQPEALAVRFHRRVRAERKFASVEGLKKQILLDAGRAQTYWRRRRGAVR